jgi:hypothetical protein
LIIAIEVALGENRAMLFQDIDKRLLAMHLFSWLVGSVIVFAIIKAHPPQSYLRITILLLILFGTAGRWSIGKSALLECATRALLLAGWGLGFMKAVESANSWLNVVIFVVIVSIAQGLADLFAQHRKPRTVGSSSPELKAKS